MSQCAKVVGALILSLKFVVQTCGRPVEGSWSVQGASSPPAASLRREAWGQFEAGARSQEPEPAGARRWPGGRSAPGRHRSSCSGRQGTTSQAK